MIGIEKLEYEIDGRMLLSNVSFAINHGEKVGLIGRNGVGKTTLLRILAGEIKQTSGIINSGKCTIGIIPQNIEQITKLTVAQYLLQITDDYGEVMRSLAQAGLADIDIERPISSLSGGQKTRVMLAGIFCAAFDLVLLDEPTNNLDSRGIKMLEEYLASSKSAFLIVTHDRSFLRSSIDRIVEFAGGSEGTYQYRLGYDEYIISREIRLQTARQEHARYQADKKRWQKFAHDTRDKVMREQKQVKSTDNDKYIANGKKQQAMRSASKKIRRAETRIDQMDAPEDFADNYGIKLQLDNSTHKHNLVLICKDLTAKYHDYDKIFGPISLNLHAGEKIMISGDNGSGKTTLLNVIAGRMPKYSGTRENLDTNIIYMDQSQTLPLPDQNALNNLSEFAPGIMQHEAINILLRLGFKKDTIMSVPARDLSGGEKAKILIAAIAKSKKATLILDEPTNNLDIPTIESLESAIASFCGGLIISSHDREFIQNIGIDREISL